MVLTRYRSEVVLSLYACFFDLVTVDPEDGSLSYAPLKALSEFDFAYEPVHWAASNVGNVILEIFDHSQWRSNERPPDEFWNELITRRLARYLNADSTTSRHQSLAWLDSFSYGQKWFLRSMTPLVRGKQPALERRLSLTAHDAIARFPPSSDRILLK